MAKSGKEKLLSLLFNGERELMNIKFFPGTGRGLTSDQMCDVASGAIESALARGPVDNPPMSGRSKSVLLDPPLRLDMDFAEALSRFVATVPKEVVDNIERSKTKKPPGNGPPRQPARQRRDRGSSGRNRQTEDP